MELFVNSLEDEILFELEGANFDIDINEEKIIRLIRNGSFPHLSYFYNGLDLKEFLLKNPFYFSGESNFFRSQKQVGEFVFRDDFKLANTISVGVKIKENPKNNYSILRRSLLEKNIRLEKIIDVEFFEFYEEQKWFLDNINGVNDSRIDERFFNKEKLWNLVKNLDKKRLDDLEEVCDILGMDISRVLDYMNDSLDRVNADVFTAFMDTEKIHLQFAKCSYKGKSKIILGYYGFGNHKPFMSSLKSRNVSENRFMRMDNLNGDLDNRYYLDKFEKSNSLEKKDLLLKLDLSQKNYPKYFDENFSYEMRRAQCSSGIVVDENFDKLFMLNPKTRGRAAALSAYIFFDKMRNFDDVEACIRNRILGGKKVSK